MPLKQPIDLENGEWRSVGDQFAACYGANFRSIRRFVARLLGSIEEADDLAQEVFSRLWSEMDSKKAIQDPRAWLYRVAGNLVTSRIRSKMRANAHQSTVEESVLRWHSRRPTDSERAAIYREIVPAVLNKLPEPMRLCLVLYHEGLTGSEMAEVLGVKQSYVGTLVLRAHERFRREYDRLEGKK